MKDVQKPDHISLVTLIGRLKDGRFVIPDFQREFEWTPADIQELIRSIFLDYYIGSLLLWKGKSENFDALACEPLYGFKGKASAEHIVLDGQQRLTAIFYALLAPEIRAPNRTNRVLFFIAVDKFMDEMFDEAFSYKRAPTSANLLKDSEAQFEKHSFPVSVVGKGGWELPDWVKGYERHWNKKAELAQQCGDSQSAAEARRHEENANLFGQHVKDIVEQYQIAYIELDRDLAIDKVCDIFTQINSRGVRLDAFDLVNALLKPKGLQLKHLWREAASSLSFLETDRMNVYVLQVMSILRQGYCSSKYLYYLLPGQPKTVRDQDGSFRKETLVADSVEFKKLWKDAVDALARAIELLRNPQEFGAIASQYLPYVSILPAFAALQATATTLPAAALDAQRKIRRWYWASVFTNRYSGAVESTSSRDFLDVKAWFGDDTLEPTLIKEFRERFRTLDLRKEVKRGTSVYNGIFNLLVLRAARDWMTGNAPQYDDLNDYHIIPKDWGRNQAKTGPLIDSILNRTPLTADTHRKLIHDRLPNKYLPELIRENGEKTVRDTLESHLISPAAFDILLRSPFTASDFEDFITERQRTLLDAIEDLLKERVDLPPKLRELDEKIEYIELQIRELIRTTLTNDFSKLPPHVQQKINDRAEIAMRKNPALDKTYKSLTGMLELCDLRELQDTLISKEIWPLVERKFGSRGSLEVRFNQLGELRNGIRHSRTVTEVAQKDGEASLLWFRQVLCRE